MILIKLPEMENPWAKPTFTPPIGLWSMLENSERFSTVVDGQLMGEVEFRALLYSLSFHPSIPLGFSIQFQTQESLFFEIIKDMKNPITVGGPHGSTLFSERFETCIGAGEEKSFEELIPPHFREDEMLLYWKRESPFGRGDSRSPAKRPFPIETSRGCPNSCNFCMMGSFWGGWKERPLEVLKEYVRWLKEKRGVDELIILDDNVSLKKERFLQILEIFKEEEMRWRAPNGIYLPSIFDVEVIMAIRDSNCTGLSLPFETGVRTTAMEMNLGRKWIDPDDARELVSLLQDIHLTGFFIIGYPGEDEEDVRETLRFANSLPLNERHIYLATPYPGSSLYERVKQAGWLREGEPATYRNALIDTPWLSSKRLLQLFHEDRDMAIRRKEGKDET